MRSGSFGSRKLQGLGARKMCGVIERIREPRSPCHRSDLRPAMRLGEETHQWQKSDETTKRLSVESKYGAKISPYAFSSWVLIAPTRMGTTLMSFLEDINSIRARLRWRFITRTYPSNILRIYGRCISMLCSSSSVDRLIEVNLPVSSSSPMASESQGMIKAVM